MTRISLILSLMLPTFLCHAEDPKSESSVTTAQAVRFLGYLHTDPDEHAKRAMEWLNLSLSKNDLATASEIAVMPRDWRAPAAAYRMAAALAESDSEAAKRWLANGDSSVMRGSNESEVNRLRAAHAAALMGLGMDKDARDEQLKISDRYQNAQTAVVFLDSAPLEELRKLVDDPEFDRFPDLKRDALITASKRFQAAGNLVEAASAAAAVVESAEIHHDATTPAQIFNAVEILHQCGEAQTAARGAALLEAMAIRTSDMAEWKTRDLVFAARALRLTGHPERADKALENITKLPAKVSPFHFAQSAAYAAQGLLHENDTERFPRAMLDVLAGSSRHPHHRARALGALEVLKLHYEYDLTPDEKLLLALHSVAEGIEKDPHYRP